MAIHVTHELHHRRKSRNMGVGLILGLLVALLFGLSIVKMKNSGPIEGYDHAVQPQLVEPSK